MTRMMMESETKTNKVILIDWNIFVFRSIFAWRLNKKIPPTYTALNMLISILRKIGCHPDDRIILAIDSPKGSWRKQHDKNYKANRKEKRESFKDVNWSDIFRQFDSLIENIKIATPFDIVQIDYYEADDIISAACRFFNHQTCIIVSSDSDYEQLLSYKHVKIFSPVSKKYKHIANPAATLLKKINKEATDNLITPITNEQEYLTRLKIVDLCHLPPDVEYSVGKHLGYLFEEKEYDLTKLFFTSLQERFMNIYNSKDIVPEFPPIPKKKRQLTMFDKKNKKKENR